MRNRKLTDAEKRALAVRSQACLSAVLRPGAGLHGGSKRDRNRRDRKSARLSLRG